MLHVCLLLALVAQEGPHAHPGEPAHTHPAPHPQEGGWVYYDYVDEQGRLAGGRVRLDDLGRADAGAAAAESGSVVTLLDNGPPENRLDLVFVGDGYTASELGTYASHVDGVWPTLLAEDPLGDYLTYFNIHRVDVVSNESGVDHDPVLGVLKDTALDMKYWCDGIQRLLCVNVAKASVQAAQAPDWDQILALANSSTYGGAGYPASNVATLAGDNFLSLDIALHELGHSLGDLADEYDYGGPTTYVGGEPPEPNVSIYDTAAMTALQEKWHLWFGATAVGTFQGAKYSKLGIYRPTLNSMMRNLGAPFHAVNNEQLVARMYDFVDPIDDATPAGTYLDDVVLFVDPIDPLFHALDVTWIVDGTELPGTAASTLDVATLGLAPGLHTVTARVVDGTDYVRDESLRAAKMTEERTWTIAGGSTPQPPLVADVTGGGWITQAGPFGVGGAFLDAVTAARLGGQALTILGGDFDSLALKAPNPLLPPGTHDLELDWSGGTVTVPDAVGIGPMLSATTTGVGGTLTAELDLGSPVTATYTLAVGGAALPAPFPVPGIYHGLLLDPTAALTVIDAQTFIGSIELVYPVPAAPALQGATLYLQSHLFAFMLPLAQCFSTLAEVTF